MVYILQKVIYSIVVDLLDDEDVGRGYVCGRGERLQKGGRGTNRGRREDLVD